MGPWRHLRLHAAIGRWLEEQFVLYQPAEVISGFAVGVDTWLALAALRLGRPLVAALRFLGQEDTWPESSQQIYRGC